jgi:outer membrane immunogenic protein
MKKKQAALTGLAALTLFDIVGAQVPAQAQTTPIFNWTGYYIGVHTGYRGGHLSGSVPTATPVFDGGGDLTGLQFASVPFSANVASGILGFHAGYNYHFSPNWLVGIETAWSWGRGTARVSAFSGESFDGFSTFNSLNYRIQLTWSGDVRARFGYVRNEWLFYGTGGIAFQHVNVSGNSQFNEGFGFDSVSILGQLSQSKVLFGYVIGAGIERIAVGGWTWRLEYLFADFGKQNFGTQFAGSGQIFGDSFVTVTGSHPLNVSLQTHTVRVGFTKLFNP